MPTKPKSLTELILITLLANMAMLLIVIFYVLCALLSTKAVAEDTWPIDLPWQQPQEPSPEVKPFELPTLKGDGPHYNTVLPALKAAPKVSPDEIYQLITRCYPEKSKFKIDIDLVAGVKASFDQYDTSDFPDITEHYVGVVGKMPIYSTTEQSREREWEHKRRVKTASDVASFSEALANRNHAYREMGIYLAMEARSQARVKQGIANVSEQIGYLEKVAAAQRDILKYEAQVVENRLALISMCDDNTSERMNNYLKRIAYLPPPKEKEPQ